MIPVPHQDFSISTDRGRLFARRWSLASDRADARAPIVLLHDSLGCVELWRDFPERLAAATGSDVIAYDRLGFGKSDGHPGKLDLDFIHAEAVTSFRALRRALGIDAFVAFGHSVGGGMAVGCAAEYPADCRALITESAQAFVEDRTIRGIEQARVGFEQPGGLDRLRRYHGDKATWVLRAWIDSWLDPDFAGWNLDEDLRRVSCPTLVLHGELDEYGSTLHPRRIGELTRGGATVHVLRACGHVPHREKPDAILDIVERWLRERIGLSAT